MSLQQVYERFLASPSSEALAPGASISYVPTLTTINDPAAILKHLTAQQKQFTKKNEKVLSAVEGGGNLCMDVDTTIEFVLGGGTILPGLDDNFLADRTIYFPMIHMVKFDSQQRIKQIRQYWDQGSLLKQVEVIGSRGRNWPIRDGKDQIRLITSLASVSAEVAQPRANGQATSSDAEDAPARSRAESGKSATRDPHATLSLFQPRDPNEQPSTPRANAVISPRASAKPAPRDLTELFAGETAGGSPSKKYGDVQAKGGAGKKFQPIRLFEQGEEETKKKSPERLKTNPKKYHHFEFDDGEGGNVDSNSAEYFEFSKNHYTGKVKTNPKKYDHFEIGEGEDASTRQKMSPSKQQEAGKHQPSWSFEDFTSPQQVKNTVRPHNMKQFGWSDDEQEHSPVRRPIVHHARPDAVSHFDLRDDDNDDNSTSDPTRKNQQQQAFRGRSHKKGLGLYEDPIFGGGGDDGDDNAENEKKQQQQQQQQQQQYRESSNQTRTSAAAKQQHRKTFGSQFEMTDSSPVAVAGSGGGGATNPKLRENQKKILKGLDASWDMSMPSNDEKGAGAGAQGTASATGKPAAAAAAPRSRKDTQPSWGFGDADEN